MALNMNSIVRRHLVLVWGGTLGTPAQEQWSNTLRLVDFSDTLVPDNKLQDAANALQAPLTTWFQSDGSKIGRAAAMTWLKLNQVDEYNHQIQQNTIRHDFTATVEGLVTNPPVPWYQTYALTMRTGAGRGRASKGRIFPPVVALQPEAQSPYCAGVAASAAATAFGTLLNSIETAINGAIGDVDGDPASWAVSIVSVGDRSKGQTAKNATVTSVEMDRVADVQHRRTNAVPRSIGAPFAVTP